MLETLKKKVENIAEKYADLVEKNIEETIKKGNIDGCKMNEINDGIRMLNHVAGTLQKLSACDGETEGGVNNVKWTDLKNAEEVFEHFGITESEPESIYHIVKNKESILENVIMQAATEGGKVKKAHIKVEYDAGFPWMLLQVITS